MARTNYCQFFNNYVYSGLDLWPITLDQGHDISLGPGQQSCEILFKSTMKIRSYGLDKLGRTPDGQHHDIIVALSEDRRIKTSSKPPSQKI
jgi:hypothetical protein